MQPSERCESFFFLFPSACCLTVVLACARVLGSLPLRATIPRSCATRDARARLRDLCTIGGLCPLSPPPRRSRGHGDVDWGCTSSLSGVSFGCEIWDVGNHKYCTATPFPPPSPCLRYVAHAACPSGSCYCRCRPLWLSASVLGFADSFRPPLSAGLCVCGARVCAADRRGRGVCVVFRIQLLSLPVSSPEYLCTGLCPPCLSPPYWALPAGRFCVRSLGCVLSLYIYSMVWYCTAPQVPHCWPHG